MTFVTHSEEETEKSGERLASGLTCGSIVALYGDLGSGKTVFVRGMARGLGINDFVSSPTFTIVNEYAGNKELFHFDMYRLTGESELFDIGWEDYLARGGICAVEWSEKVTGAFPGNEVRVSFERLSENSRKITISASDR